MTDIWKAQWKKDKKINNGSQNTTPTTTISLETEDQSDTYEY